MKAVKIYGLILAVWCWSIGLPGPKILGATPTVFPTIDMIYDSDLEEIDTISAAGGEVIIIEGYDFSPNAKVYFVPVLQRYNSASSASSSSGSTSVIYTEGRGGTPKKWTLASGTAGAKVTVEDSQTIEVTTPSGLLFTWGIIVVNEDGAASEIYEDLTYDFPQPAAPLDVTVHMVHDSSGDRDLGIRISWDQVPGATNYEIYRVYDGDYYYLTSTNQTSYMYTDLKNDTDYRFAVKAVDDCGISEASYLSRTISTDEVGSYESMLIQENEPQAVRSGSRAFLNLNDLTFYPRNIHMDLTKGALKGCHEVVVDIPLELVVNTRQHQIEIKGRGYNLKLSPSVFATTQVRGYAKYKAGIRFRWSEARSASYRMYAGRALSPIYQMEANLMYGPISVPLVQLDGFMELSIQYNGSQVQWGSPAQPGLCYFDSFDEIWVKKSIYGMDLGGQCSSWVDRTGYYKVISQ